MNWDSHHEPGARTMVTAAPRRSTEAEDEAFVAACDRLGGFDRTLSPFHVDGWLTAMACGPVRLPAAQWLELMCGDAFERAFADPPDRAQALAALEVRLAALTSMLDAQALLAKPDEVRLDPFFDDWPEDGEEGAGGSEGSEGGEGSQEEPPPDGPPESAAPEQGIAQAGTDPLSPEAAANMLGSLWAQGFLFGLEALGKAWGLPEHDEQLDEAMQELADQVEALLFAHDSEEMRQFLAEYHQGKPLDRDGLLLNACFAAQDLRLFLLDHGPRPETRRVAAQPGRNDPCPCGSGKKYKKCHGA